MQTSITLKNDRGSVTLDGALQGRIFAELDGECLHRRDRQLEAHPDPVEFNNIGGNSLWPAPEGGPYAFNYLKEGEWLVQPGVNRAVSSMIGASSCERTVCMKNFHGASLTMTFRRAIALKDVSETATQFGLSALSYEEDDEIRFAEPMPMAEAVVAAWSLEQFPGAEGVVAFGRMADDKAAREAVNCNFYGNPMPRLSFMDNWFRFSLGGQDRLQIGVSAAAAPALIGAYDPSRSLLIVRHGGDGVGKRIDIADNEQPNGVFGADDQYSIFNGASLNFFELETIAPMDCTADGRVIGSRLHAQTTFFRGKKDSIESLLLKIYGAPAGLIVP